MATSSGTVVDRMVDALRQVDGAYSIVAVAENCVIGCRDPHGVRPLVLGRLGDAYLLASESCAFDIVGVKYVRDIGPGEMVVLNSEGLHSHRPFPPAPQRFCIFEYIYFSRPDSVIEGLSVYQARKCIGAELAREAPVEADLVVPVPDLHVPSAIGSAHEASLPYEMGIIRNHYVGRTFIEPSSEICHLYVAGSNNANRAHIEGKRVVLVDDLIVRGTTSSKIVEMVRDAGAKEVHMRISSPPTTHSCFYGVDTPERDQLLASKLDIEGMRELIADSLAFISMDGLYRAMGAEGRTHPLRLSAMPVSLAIIRSG